MRPGIIGGGRGPIAGTRLPIEGFFEIVPVLSNWSQIELFFNEFVAPESNAPPCCDIGVIWVQDGQDAVAKGFLFGFSSNSSSILILDGSFFISFGFNECSEFVRTGVLLLVGSGGSKFRSSIPC